MKPNATLGLGVMHLRCLRERCYGFAGAASSFWKMLFYLEDFKKLFGDSCLGLLRDVRNLVDDIG